MNIEIANRLVQLRKQKGYSQEELADKLGISRQAVSKWERAEASPDTDNLICLAKLYGVSLDDLLNSDESIEDIADRTKDQQAEKEKEKEEDPEQTVIDDDGDQIKIKGGIHIKDKDGDEVHISSGEVYIKDAESGKIIRKDLKMSKFAKFMSELEGSLFLVAVVAYILLGSLAGLWAESWCIFFLPELICSIFRAIHKRRFCAFNAAFAALFAFFFVCMWVPGTSANLWHPMWVVFLGIPTYYTIFGSVDRVLKDNEVDENIIDAD